MKMRPITLDNITKAVVSHGDGGESHPRLYEIYTSLVKHLHAFVREVELTEEELILGREFLTEAAKPKGELPMGEIHMMTDLLGISVLVDLLADKRRGEATETNVEGPLYTQNPPKRAFGELLGKDDNGEPLFMSGRVLSTDGTPIAGATVDAWQPDSKGKYDLQDPTQEDGNFRGQYTTDEEGRYRFQTVRPLGYNIPYEGTVCGDVLTMLGRHTWRPAHIHFKVGAEGYVPITTITYIEGAKYIDSDTTFSVKDAVITLTKHEDEKEIKEMGLNQPFWTTEFDFVLKPSVEHAVAAE